MLLRQVLIQEGISAPGMLLPSPETGEQRLALQPQAASLKLCCQIAAEGLEKCSHLGHAWKTDHYIRKEMC